jgi:epoxyqueuosine reductase
MEPDEPQEDVCLQCGKCIEACPTGALSFPYIVNSNSCLSYWSQSKKDIPKKFRDLMKNNIVGCDVCQDVCPMNRNVLCSNELNFKLIPELNSVTLIEILKMNNKEYKKMFANSAASWCGKRVLQRNALIALGNSGDEKFVEEIIPFLNDERPQIRKHAAWALGKLGGKKSMKALNNCLKKEENIEVIKEIKEFIKNEA